MLKSMTLYISSLFSCKRGLAAMEFAIVAPMLALMLVGAIDLGMAYVQAQRLESAVHTGTQRLLHDPITASDTTLVEMQGLEEYFNQTVTDGERESLPVKAAARCFLVCPDATETTCGSTCSSGAETGTYVELTLKGKANMTLVRPFTGQSDITLTRTSIVRVQ
jgi:Flp pilus assembly protein TadG